MFLYYFVSKVCLNCKIMATATIIKARNLQYIARLAAAGVRLFYIVTVFL